MPSPIPTFVAWGSVPILAMVALVALVALVPSTIFAGLPVLPAATAGPGIAARPLLILGLPLLVLLLLPLGVAATNEFPARLVDPPVGQGLVFAEDA